MTNPTLMTGEQWLDVLKVINCMDVDEWFNALGVAEWYSSSEFDVIWHRYKKEGLFRALCEFDPDNLNKLLDYAVAKKAFSSASHHFEK